MATWMFAVYDSPTSDPACAAGLTDLAASMGDCLDYREAPEVDDSQ
jgi:hypothetical protein